MAVAFIFGAHTSLCFIFKIDGQHTLLSVPLTMRHFVVCELTWICTVIKCSWKFSKDKTVKKKKKTLNEKGAQRRNQLQRVSGLVLQNGEAGAASRTMMFKVGNAV